MQSTAASSSAEGRTYWSAQPPLALVTGHSYGDGVTEILEAEDISVLRGDPPEDGVVAPIVESRRGDLADVDVIVVSHMDSCRADVISAAPRLHGIVSTVIGLETVDIPAADARDLIVAHGAMEENYLGVAEATVMLIGALLLDLPGKQRALQTGSAGRGMKGRMVSGKRIGLIGLGRAARGVVERLQGWGVDVTAYDPFVDDTIPGVRMVDLSELLSTSDVVSIHVMLTDATSAMIGETELRSMKSDAYLINTARGAVVDETALVRALEEGWITGAALDVFAEEPLPADHPLRDLDSVILTPHAIGHSRELWEAIPRVAADQTMAILSGEVPRYVVNPDVVTRWEKRYRAESGMS